MKNNLKLSDIPGDCLYEGYIWWSDKTSPEILHNNPLPELPTGNNPFIVEGHLIDKHNMRSYSIKFVGGYHLINYYDLNQINEKEYIMKEYLPNRIKDVQSLSFKEVWRPQVNELCEGMNVLQPAEIIFVGFKF